MCRDIAGKDLTAACYPIGYFSGRFFGYLYRMFFNLEYVVTISGGKVFAVYGY
jgi:hypothetical protein